MTKKVVITYSMLFLFAFTFAFAFTMEARAQTCGCCVVYCPGYPDVVSYMGHWESDPIYQCIAEATECPQCEHWTNKACP